jgi:hypothetical protein
MKISLLNNFHGDQGKEFETTTPEGRAQAAKMVDELLRSGSAVFLEREVNGETYTYRVTKYDAATNKLTIRLDLKSGLDDGVELPRRKNAGRKGRPLGPYRTRRGTGTLDADSGQVVSVAPRSGG